MARPRKRYAFKIYELQPEEAGPKAPPKLIEAKRMVMGDSVDDCLRTARAQLVDEGRVVRALNIGPDGIAAVVFPASHKRDSRTIRESRLKVQR